MRLLLARYGIVSRQILALDGAAVAWGTPYPVLTRMEWRGELARGLFVEGLAGAQFAREETLSGLEHGESGWTLLSTTDPAVVYGAGAPFPVTHPTDPEWRLRRGPGSFLVLQGGLPLLAIEGWGERLTALTDLASEELQQGLALLPRLVVGPLRRLTVHSWNGAPVMESPIEGMLRDLGFQRGPDALILYRRYG
ncbi:MAG TPA: hypothetical protein ENN53_06395 [Candidatus Acetothermia bacterium]|nr:hypothetical protein [Candidatus Acetothermia bacterium]